MSLKTDISTSFTSLLQVVKILYNMHFPRILTFTRRVMITISHVRLESRTSKIHPPFF